MLKCFKVVYRVLEDSYNEVPGTEAERDAAITTALQGLSTTYKRVLSGGGPNFADPINRFAYVFTYVPVHAHWVYELLKFSPDAAAVLEQEKVRIACIGGGPGSDLVGILKFLDERGGDQPAIFCEIVDGCEQWKLTWADIGFTLGLPAGLHSDYVIHRIGDPDDPDVWIHPTKFQKADLFTLNFFVSEIAHLGAPAWEYIERVLLMAKPGAVLLFNDNNDTRFFEKFDEIVARLGWEVLVTGNGDRRVYDTGERLADLGRFTAKFAGRGSRLVGNVAWRVLRKPVA